jgi:UDP-N-acetylmuramoylalanine-D-glutamate ligase
MTQLELVDGAVRGSAFLEQLTGSPVTIVGQAREAAAVVKILQAAGAQVRVEAAATRVDLTGDALVVVTGATALHARAVVAARQAGVAVLGDLDVAWLASGAEAFAITSGAEAGTATALAAAILAAHDRSVVSYTDEAAGGTRESDVLLVEPSVDQLSAMQVFRPRVAVILRGAQPLAVRLIEHQTARDCLVVTDDPALRALAGVSRAGVVWLSPEHAVDHGVYVARGRIAARLNGHVEEIGPVDGVPATELEATLAAVACALWAGLDPEAIGTALTRRFLAERDRVDRLPTPVGAGGVSSGLVSARTLASRARAMFWPGYAEHRPGSAGAVASVGGARALERDGGSAGSVANVGGARTLERDGGFAGGALAGGLGGRPEPPKVN